MIASQATRKQLIDFLISRWQLITSYAAMEKVYIAQYKFAKSNDMPIPNPPILAVPYACRQIEIIKQHIIKILPETHFIDYTFEPPAPLEPNDWIEIFIADNHQCIGKVKEVIKKMQSTCLKKMN